MQRSRGEPPFVSNLTARNTKTRSIIAHPDDRSVPHSATPSASRRLSKCWSRVLSNHRPLITDHHPGWFSQWHICFPGPRVPLRTVHVAILCWCHRLPITDRISSDHGGEFQNAKFDRFCEKHGIIHSYCAPRTPQQNGVAERKNRSLDELARTMLNESNLPKYFWADAVYVGFNSAKVQEGGELIF